MATTTYGTTYVQSSDLVSGWPGSSLSVADRIDDVSFKGNGLNDQTGTTYTFVLTDAGKTVTGSNASSTTYTIPTNASVAYETGTGISIINKGAGVITLVGAGGVTLNGASLTINQYESGTIRKLDTNTWVMVKGGGLPKASYSATTGSPTVTTVGGKTCVQFTGSGSITISTAGLVEVLTVGGGGGGGSSNCPAGGAGGYVALSDVYLSAATHTVTVGAGGAIGILGQASKIGNYVTAVGGGAGNRGTAAGDKYGGSGGGGSEDGGGQTGGSSVPGQGNNGGNGASTAGGGGGGANAVGANATSGVGGAGGAGISSSITGSAVTRGGGGGGAGTSSSGAGGSGGGGAGSSSGTATSGTANTGGGGGGSRTGTGGSGGSGLVILLFG